MIYLFIALAFASLVAAAFLSLQNRSLRRSVPRQSLIEQAIDSSPLAPARTQDPFASHAVAEAIFEQCGAAVLLVDSCGRILQANTTAANLLQIPASDLAHRSVLEASLSAELHRIVQMSLQERRAIRQDACVPSAGGRCLSISTVPLAEAGGPIRLLVMAQDITDLRRLETIRRDFVANVSHELRTPLASIRAMAETLQDGALHDPSVSQRFLETITAEAQRLTRISDDLLILSRAESKAPEPQTFDLAGLVGELLEAIAPQAEKAGVALTSQVQPGLAIVASRDQIEQVQLNLIANAFKYTPSGGCVDVIHCATTRDSLEP